MATGNGKEQWIDEVLASTQGIARADAPAGLYDKVMAELNAPKTIRGISLPLKQWVAAAVVLIAVNIASVVYFSANNRPGSGPADQLAAQVQQESIYNY
jgi:hypothetical protein